MNLEGDDQADRSVHGGPDKAIYAYASEDTAWWEAQFGTTLGPGAFGENLTVAGLDLSAMEVGQRWRVGSDVLEVSQPRLPCFKLGLRFGNPQDGQAASRWRGAPAPICGSSRRACWRRATRSRSARRPATA